MVGFLGRGDGAAGTAYDVSGLGGGEFMKGCGVVLGSRNLKGCGADGGPAGPPYQVSGLEEWGIGCVGSVVGCESGGLVGGLASLRSG
jgi:hypothetical protein